MIDTHCHLQEISDIDAGVQRCRAAGIVTLICNGYDLQSSKKALRIARSHDEVWATVGVHPEESLKSQILNPNEFLKLINHKKVVAIGETGLDAPDSAQIELFEWHIQLAKKADLPLVVHCRNAFEEVFQVLSTQNSVLRVQMHCWTGSWDWAKKFLDLGCYLSFGGVVTFKNSHELQGVVKLVTADRLLIETDSPYISPEPVRGKPNSPANLMYIARLIAQLRNITVEELDKLTTDNAYRLFPKLKLPRR